MTTKNIAAILGFAFVAAWIAFGFGNAILCLLGAGAFYAIAAIMRGEVDLGELQDRFGSRSSSPPAPGVPPAGPRRSRVR